MTGKAKGSGGGGRKTTSPAPRKGGPVRRFVEPNTKGDGYRVVAPKAKQASAVEPTKRAAGKRATEIVTNLGGGEVKGRIVDSDTVGGGNDPNPPRDRKH
jgi:hypothetical protein